MDEIDKPQFLTTRSWETHFSKILASTERLVGKSLRLSHGSRVQSLKREASFSLFASKRAAMVEVPEISRDSYALHAQYSILTVF